MSTKKAVKEELKRLYGNKCMICEGIRKLNPPKPSCGKYTGKKQKKKMRNMLTLHHIVPVKRYKARGIQGETSVENGALLCETCHVFLEQLPDNEREKLNKELKRYKAEFGTVRKKIEVNPKPEECTIIQVYYDKELQDMIFEDNLDEIRY